MTTKTEFHALRVTDIRRETADAVSVRLDVPETLHDHFRFDAGQYLTLRTLIDDEDVRRNYSVCSAPHDGELRIAVKRLPGGRFSTFVNEALRIGDEIDVLPAAGHFTTVFSAGNARRYAAFAAGSGITPVLSLIKAALAVEPGSRFTLFYGNRTSSQILFLEELAALKNRFMGRLEIFHFLTMEAEDAALFNGRLDRGKCDEILSTLIDPGTVDLFFACGPEEMMEGVEQALLARNVPEDRILLERFASAGFSPALDATARARASAAAGRRLGIILDGRTLTVAFDAERGNILESVRAAGAEAPFACKSGVCATCRAKIISGAVEMRVNYGLTKEEVAAGYILTCQSTPTTDDVVVSYDC